jgi:hypothetical protein
MGYGPAARTLEVYRLEARRWAPFGVSRRGVRAEPSELLSDMITALAGWVSLADCSDGNAQPGSAAAESANEPSRVGRKPHLRIGAFAARNHERSAQGENPTEAQQSERSRND